jgi:thymidylate synthase
MQAPTTSTANAPHPMQQFHDMLAHILAEGKRRPNRTGIDTLFVPGHMLKFDLEKDGFPAITTKRLAFKSAKGELCGFFRGYTNAAQFRAIDCKVWDGNANETKSWLANPYRKGIDDLFTYRDCFCSIRQIWRYFFVWKRLKCCQQNLLNLTKQSLNGTPQDNVRRQTGVFIC